MNKQTEGIEKAIASAVGSALTVIVAVTALELDVASVEAISLGLAAIATPLLTWLTANSKKDVE